MKKQVLLTLIVGVLFSFKLLSQTVYVGEAEFYHRSSCKLVGKSFEATPLWKAQNRGKKPCKKCKPPIKEGSAAQPKTKKAPAKKK